MITKISDLYQLVEKQSKPKKIAVAAAHDEHALDAVYKAWKKNIVVPVLVGDLEKIEKIATENSYDFSTIEIIDEKNNKKAVEIAVDLVRSKKADILMKGNVQTADLLRGVLNEEKGLKTSSLLSHFSIFDVPNYHKVLGITDVAMNIAPTLKEKISIINNAVSCMNALGVAKPKVAVLGAVETVSDKMPATEDAAILSKMAQRKQIANCIIDGPLALDNALSKESAHHKGIESDVAGDADILLCPDIEAGNILYKILGFTGAELAAVILGAKAPIVLTSRADSESAKLNSILLAAVISEI
jgi:phosphate butyryltransferase